ncbi:MAG: ABC transporter substrate-binding protein, partial [Acidimicrobiales bacterium]
MRQQQTARLALALVLLVSAFACGGGSADDADAAERVTLRLDWLPRANHAFFFLALEEGFYEDEGIDLEILDGTGSGNAVTLVGSGREEFGFASLVTLSLAVASEEVPVVSV